jgi:uncharacterized membrane protein required for colicin V production
MPLLDGVVGVVLLVALARGLWIGLIREGFSMGALAAAVLVTRAGLDPASDWLVDVTGGQIGEMAAPWIAGSVLAGATAIGVGFAGRLIRRGFRYAGLSWADRMGGAALGFAEGALVALVLMLGATTLVGRDHPAIADSRALAVYDDVREIVDERRDDLPDVPDLPHVALPGDG